jgi:hypothetical protein
VKVGIAAGLAVAFVAKFPEAMAAQMSRLSTPMIYSINPRSVHNSLYIRHNEI